MSLPQANLEIKDQALFVADSHYPHHGDAFLRLLQSIESHETQTPQLFLMGDNFDLLFGYNDYIQTFSQPAITLLQKLSTEIEIIYFEGNHDFCLQEIFPHIRVYSREAQPTTFIMGEERVALSHGDKYATGLLYDVYSKLLRNRWTLRLLKPFERKIIDHRMSKLSQKHICHHFGGFEKRVQSILSSYPNVDRVIEGHFHQGKIIDRYISLPSLACQNQLALYKDKSLQFIDIKSVL